MKTSKYIMYINTVNTSGAAIPISKKEFQRQIKHYKKEIAGNHACYKDEIDKLKSSMRNWRYSDIEDCLDDIRITTEEDDKYTKTTYSVRDSGATIIFCEIVCKPGYCFNTKKEENHGK